MKQITLALILGLGATIAKADEFAIVDDIFRSIDPLAQRDEYGPLHQGKDVNATLQVAMDLLLQGQRTTHRATGLCWLDANRVAPTGLLLRPDQRRIYSRGKRRHHAASKELFHAGDWHADRSSPARIAHALTILSLPARQSLSQRLRVMRESACETA